MVALLFALLALAASASPPPPSPSVSWSSPSLSVLGSMPLGNGRLGLNVWAEDERTVSLLPSHVGALDENGILSKLGRVTVTLSIDEDEDDDVAPPSFSASYFLNNMTASFALGPVTLTVWVDASYDVLHLTTLGPRHSLLVSVDNWRLDVSRPYHGWDDDGSGTWCDPSGVLTYPDVVYCDRPYAATLHRNDLSRRDSFADDLKSQGLEQEWRSGDLGESPLLNLTFGMLVVVDGVTSPPPARPTCATSSSSSSSSPLQLPSASSGSHALSIVGLAEASSDSEAFVDSMWGTLLASGDAEASADRSAKSWEDYWRLSDVEVLAAPRPENESLAAAAGNVTLLDRLHRSLFHAMANPEGDVALKFNGYGIFSAYETPYEDWRPWGPSQWFQNVRLPYYGMLAQGAFDDMKSLFRFYEKFLNISEARVKKWAGATKPPPGDKRNRPMEKAEEPPMAFFPETMTQGGAYAEGDYGWGCGNAANSTFPMNTYIRYHREGGLELSLLALDWLDYTQDWEYFQRHLLRQVEAYVSYYLQYLDGFGAFVQFPAQALETWQCPNTSTACVRNPTPELAGLHQLLPRLLSLRAPGEREVFAARTVERWTELLRALPELTTKVDERSGNTAIEPGEIFPKLPRNFENPELYSVFPFRVVGIFANQSLGESTYRSRLFPGNTGWSQDLLDAALLGLGDEAATLLAERASAPPSEGYRFPTFQEGVGSDGPITDGGGVATAGLRVMLLQAGLKGEGKERTILLLPAWPCDDWMVSFKLHAPFGTVVEGRYDGEGKIVDLEVTPKERAADVSFGRCVLSVQWKASPTLEVF